MDRITFIRSALAGMIGAVTGWFGAGWVKRCRECIEDADGSWTHSEGRFLPGGVAARWTYTYDKTGRHIKTTVRFADGTVREYPGQDEREVDFEDVWISPIVRYDWTRRVQG